MASVSEQKIEPLENNTSLTPVQSLRSEKQQGNKGKVRYSGVQHIHPHTTVTQRWGNFLNQLSDPQLYRATSLVGRAKPVSPDTKLNTASTKSTYQEGNTEFRKKEPPDTLV